MNNITSKERKKDKSKFLNLDTRVMFLVSFILLFIYLAPIIVLRENSYHGIHDNLDSNHINSVINARNDKQFGVWHNKTPQLLGGLPRIPGPSLGVISMLYGVLSPYNALMINNILVHLIAFLGMLLLLKNLIPGKFEDYRAIYFLAAISFALIRFWANAGISVAGIPLLFYGFLNVGTKRFIPYAIAIIYAFYSSFVLVGMFALIFLGVWEIYEDFRQKKVNLRRWVFIVLVFLFYLISSYKLVLSTFASVPIFVSHRMDYNMQHFNKSWIDAIMQIPNMIFNSYGHNAGFPLIPILLSLAVIITCRVRKSADRRMEFVLWVIISLSILSAILETKTWISIQQRLPLFKMVQLQRFYWLLTPCQYALFFYALIRLAIFNRARLALIVGVAQIFVLFSWNVNYRQLIKKNLFHKEVFPTYDEFYSVDLLSQIRDFIGKPQDSYRVVSIGLEPAVALYNGFYSLEGYSGSYPIEHKRVMRQVMAAELDKNEFLANNYDGWGNKVTLFSDDIDRKIGYPSSWDIPIITKRNSETIENLEIRNDLLLDSNCKYIFSALEIVSPAEKGLIFMSSFEDKVSPYRIYLYQITHL